MVIKYQQYVRGNLRSGFITVNLNRDNFDLRSGNWEFNINQVAMAFKEKVPQQLIGIRLDLLKSWTEDDHHFRDFGPAVLSFAIVKGDLNDTKVFKDFESNKYSFNQVQEEFNVSFVNLITNDIFKGNIEVRLTLDFTQLSAS